MIEMMLASNIKRLSGKQAAFTIPGTYTWIVPEGVTSISAVAVGGGGGAWDRTSGSAGTWGSSGAGGSLRYKTTIPVTPGEQLTVIVGAAGTNSKTSYGVNGGYSYIKRGTATLLQANGGRSGGASGSNSVTNTTAGGVGDGGGDGGNGVYYSEFAGGGGGAGGYSGNGGAGSVAEFAPGSGAGGAGGGGYGTPRYGYIAGRGGRGGGVGIFGAGANGAGAGFVHHKAGGDGSQYPDSGAYGGGASEPSNGLAPVPAQGGAVRIVWGTGRQYPNYVPDV